MATYYYNSTKQRDVMPTLYLSDPGHMPYPESSQPANTTYLNFSTCGSYSNSLASSSQSQQNCIELPVPTTYVSQESSVAGSDLTSCFLGAHTFNAWRDGRNEMLLMHTIDGSTNSEVDLIRTSVANNSRMTQMGVLHGQNSSLQQSNGSGIRAQGLSLSLSTQIPMPAIQYHPASSDIAHVGSHQSDSGNCGSCRDDNSRDKQIPANPSSYGISSSVSTIPNSKYLKATQLLLDEVVNVRKALKSKADKIQMFQMNGKDKDGESKCDGMPQNLQESTVNSDTELSPSERQDLQNKMSKLLAMMDEVDRRYKQYYHQMQIVVSSFDAVASCGAAKPYTALALQTISRHFRCLRDAINSQIQATRKTLGELDASSGGKADGISRLRYIDQHIRQQRAFQQFGMMQPHAWRPQRGLPETSVSVLRAWLFEHFLHPYPKDSDKLMLARQTGLTRSQVSNWFINARVRLWKPMVEEMYKEELGDAEMDSNTSSENALKGKDEFISSEDRDDAQSIKQFDGTGDPQQHLAHFLAQSGEGQKCHEISKSTFIPDMGTDTGAISQNEVNPEDLIHPGDQRPTAEDCRILQDAHALVQSDGSNRLMAYQMAELGRYGSSGISLTLGLQHCDGGLPVSENQQGFLMRGDGIFNGNTSLGTGAADYDCMNLADRRQRFGSAHLLA